MNGARSPRPFPSTSCTRLRCSNPTAGCAGASLCPAAAQHRGAEGLMLSEEAVCAFQCSAQPLHFLSWCCDSKTSWPTAFPPRGSAPHLPGTSATPTAMGNTHQLHLWTQSFQDAVGSFCLLLHGGKGRGKKKLFLPLTTAALLPSTQTPSQPHPPAPARERGTQESPAGEPPQLQNPHGQQQKPPSSPSPALESQYRAGYLGTAAARASRHAHRDALSRIHRSVSM